MTKSGNRSPRHLSDTALVLLGRTADSETQMLLPIPKTVKAHGKVLERVLRSLLTQGLVEELPVGLAEEAWRSDHEGRYGLRITAAGLKAICVPALECGLGNGARGEHPTGAGIGGAAPRSSPKVRQAFTGRPGTKQARLIDSLRQPSGQTTDALVAERGWQAHTVRAAITGLRKSGHAISRTRNDGGHSVYRIEPGVPTSADVLVADQES